MSQTTVAPPISLTVSSPPFAAVLHALGGIALLGTCAALGSPYIDTALRTAPSGLVIAVGAVALTSPALVVTHQLMALNSRPQAIVAELARSVVRLGALCAGLAPFVLFFSLTSGLAAATYLLAMGCALSLTAASTARRLVAVERQHVATAAGAAPMLALTLAWLGLTALVALRLTFTLL